MDENSIEQPPAGNEPTDAEANVSEQEDEPIERPPGVDDKPSDDGPKTSQVANPGILEGLTGAAHESSDDKAKPSQQGNTGTSVNIDKSNPFADNQVLLVPSDPSRPPNPGNTLTDRRQGPSIRNNRYNGTDQGTDSLARNQKHLDQLEQSPHP